VRRLLVYIAVALGALAVPATSSAVRAVHLQDAVDISNSFQSALLSGACGFPVTVTVSGALDETLIYNDAGLVVRQIENTHAATATFSSPYGSFSFPEAATSVYTYAGGATLGSTANFTSSGLLRLTSPSRRPSSATATATATRRSSPRSALRSARPRCSP